MANALYARYKSDLLKAATTDLDLDNATANIAPWAVLVGTYTSGAADGSHQFYSQLTDVRGTPTEGQITGVSISNTGVFITSMTTLTFTAVASGSAINHLIIYRKNAGANTSWSLVADFDTAGGSLPVTPNGGNITVTWATTPVAGNIFQL
jgi:hypothetical protein